jgi:hypothetical protein
MPVDLVNVQLIGLVERGREPPTLRLRIGEGRLHRLQPRLGRDQRLVGFDQAARGLRQFAERLVERGLHGAPLLVDLHRLLLCGLDLALELNGALVGCDDTVGELAILVARQFQIGALLLDLALHFGDVVAARVQFGDLSGLGPFQRGHALLRHRDEVLEADGFGLESCGLLFRGAELVAQLAVGQPRVVEHGLQAELLALAFLVGAQRLGDRIDQLADRALDDLEFADLVFGVHQEIADGFVLLAELRRDRGEQLVVELHIGLRRRVGGSCGGRGGGGLRHAELRDG